MTGLTLPHRITGEQRVEVARQIAALYESGASLADLVALTGKSYCAVRNLALEGGAVMRPPVADNDKAAVPAEVMAWLYLAKGMTLREVAEFVDRSPNSVSRVLHGSGVDRRAPGSTRVSVLEEENAALRRELDSVRSQIREVENLHAEAQIRRRVSTYVVDCDDCGRPAGKKCKYPNGRVRDVHLSRIVKAFYATPGPGPGTPERVKELESEVEALRRAISPYVVPCPRCEVAAGDRCQHPDGRMAPTHVDRIVKAFHAVPASEAVDPGPSADPAVAPACGEPWPNDRRVRCQQDAGHYPDSYHRAVANEHATVAWA